MAVFLVLACGTPASAPDLAILSLEVVADHARTSALADSLRAALACRLDQRGIRVVVPEVDAIPTDSLATPERVGRRLGAAWVLSGSVFAERESIRVVLHLTQVQDDRGAWVGTFLGALTARDTLQVEMAEAVSTRLPISRARRPPESTRPTACNEAPAPH